MSNTIPVIRADVPPLGETYSDDRKSRLADKVNTLTEIEAQAALELFQRLTLEDQQAILALVRAVLRLTTREVQP